MGDTFYKAYKWTVTANLKEGVTIVDAKEAPVVAGISNFDGRWPRYIGTGPHDTDGDGYSDIRERYYGTDPENRDDQPTAAKLFDLRKPDQPEGLAYRNMGTMENHVWSVITKRMKHGHRNWSKRGGNHLAKILAKKCSGKLYEVTERLRRPVFEEEKVEELYGAILMSEKAPKKDGKGYEYPAIGHVVGLNGKIQGERKRLLYMAGY